VQLLIEHGADVTSQDRSQKTPLHLTFSGVSFRTGSLLIWLRLDSNGQYDRDFTRDYHNEHSEKVENVRLLIKNGADVNAQDETHSTPLHMASSSGFPRLVELLIDHGADVTARDRRHRTPLHLALSWVGFRIALLFIECRLI
jgi:ankyrin repeat protein